jgi:hypothetical protein
VNFTIEPSATWTNQNSLGNTAIDSHQSFTAGTNPELLQASTRNGGVIQVPGPASNASRVGVSRK